MMFIAFIFYSIAISIINKKVDKIRIDIIAALYFLVVIGLTFFKSSYTNGYYINLNLFSILSDFQDHFNHALLITSSNTLTYLPLGIYIKDRIRVSNKKLLLGYLLYIFLIEIIQLITRTGTIDIIDIIDIITNTIGFF